MFDIGFWEIFLILILALVVIGPERLPGAARTFGLWVGKTRRYVEGVKNDVEKEFDVSEFKSLIRNQEVQLKELQEKINQNTMLSSNDLLDSNESKHSIEDEIPVADNKTGSKNESPE